MTLSSLKMIASSLDTIVYEDVENPNLDIEYQKFLIDSILQLTEEERNMDSVFQYSINTFFVHKSGALSSRKEMTIRKLRRTVEEDGGLYNTPLSLISLILYIGVLILTIRKRYSISDKVGSFLICMLVVIAIVYGFIFHSLIFNINELITREKEKHVKTVVVTQTEWGEVVSGRGTVRHRTWVYNSYFNYIADNGIKHIIPVYGTSFDVEGRDRGIESLTLCVNEKNGKIACLIPWHKTSNIIYMPVDSFTGFYNVSLFRAFS